MQREQNAFNAGVSRFLYDSGVPHQAKNNKANSAGAFVCIQHQYPYAICFAMGLSSGIADF